ncbi:MAG TPA: phenylalanine--tRNA ligase subunit alpha [Thermoleophilaceae bacterium]
MADPMSEAQIAELQEEAREALAQVGSAVDLEALRIQFLGRNSALTNTLRSIGSLQPEVRAHIGQVANAARVSLERSLEAKREELEASELDAKLAEDRIDVTLPGDPPSPAGHLHLVTQTRREMEDIFIGLGFNVVEGPEVEFDHYNFTTLNIPPNHPARALQDTFYLSPDVVLRTHTSPMQTRSMEIQPPPIYIVVPGRVYRRDSDASHTPMFHQLEGLAVDENITLGDLRGVLLEFARAMFGAEREVRLRSGYFPFTEPSVEVDISCFNCGGSGYMADGSRDPLCKGSGWIEILGSGMVDPNVYGFVSEMGYDPEKVSGFAFGMGIDRIAMLKYGVPDLRLMFENDLRFLEQF